MEIKTQKHILIVEDSIDLQTLLARLLSKKGYKISTAFNGQEALNLLRTMDDIPNLILLDIMMPVMNGIVFRQELQKDPRFSLIPIVVMTADSHPETRNEMTRVMAFMQKPIDIKALLTIAEKSSS